MVLPGTRPAGAAAEVDTALGRLALCADAEHHPGPEVSVLLRPEQLRRSTTADPPGSPAAAAPGGTAEITDVRFHGPDATVTLRMGELTVAARWPSTDLAAAGTSVRLVVVGDAMAFAPESRTGPADVG